MTAISGGMLVGTACYYGAASLLVFLLYGFDKMAAIRGWRRLREDTLHLFALLGGWPGAYVGQKLFRHKTRKQPFRTVFWITVVLNAIFLVWLVSPYGAEVVQRISARV